jgi:hypothetical protein
LAAQLVQLRVDLIFAIGDEAIEAARRTTSTVPILMVGVAPVWWRVNSFRDAMFATTPASRGIPR